MALSQLRMHHLATGALPPRTNEECEYVEALEGADADAGCDAPADLPTDPPADPPAATPMESPGDPPADPPADAPAGALAEDASEAQTLAARALDGDPDAVTEVQALNSALTPMDEVASIALAEGEPIDGPQGPSEPPPIPPFLASGVTPLRQGRPAAPKRRR